MKTDWNTNWNTIKNEVSNFLSNKEMQKTLDISQEHISAAIAEVNRALQQYDAKNLIVVVTGLLKAGKSTLINLLAHNANISPVGYGIDTTLRPAMVVSGDSRFDKEGGIEVFMPKKGWLDKIADKKIVDDQEEETEEHRQNREEEENKYRRLLMMNILDYFRLENIELNSDIIKRVEYRDLKKNEKKLRNLLCTKPSEGNTLLPTEPLLVVIHTPASEESLLRKGEGSQHGIMLLDMPGLDSGNMAVKTAKLYRELLWESDMVLFLQSSVAPLNEKGKDTFKDVIGNRTDLTAWIVHNMMNTKPWLKDSVVEAENKKQVKLTREHLNEILISTRSVEPQEVNLGLAYDSIFNQNDIDKKWQQKEGQEGDTFETSGFPRFKDKIRENINKRGAEVHDQHCRENLSKAIKKLSSQVEHKLKKQNGKLKSLKNIEQQLNEANRKAQEEFSFSEILQNSSLDWGKKRLGKKMQDMYEAQHANNLKPHKSGNERMLSKVDKELHEFGKNCLALVNDHMRSLDIWDGILWTIKNKEDETSNILKTSRILIEEQTEIYGNIDAARYKGVDAARYKFFTIPSKKYEDIKGWKKIDPIAEHTPFKKTGKRFWGLVRREVSGTYEYDDVEACRDRYINGYLEQAKIMVDNLHKQLLEDLSKTAKASISSSIQQGGELVRNDIKETEDVRTKLNAYLDELNTILAKI